MRGIRSWADGAVRIFIGALAMASLFSSIGEARAQSTPAGTTDPAVTYASQGWSDADREVFYGTSQGSRLMPYAWFRALRRLDADEPFAADQLQRYGYLRNDNPNNVAGLPVGFVVEKASGELGMTCAACHTGQLEYQKGGRTFALRLDGAPANADFQQFLLDLAAASRATLAQSDRFAAFAEAVLGAGHTAGAAASLKADFEKWTGQFGDFMDRSLPSSPWGPGRLDAFGMIFNRVAGRDLDVPGNFAKADAPVSYPFLWNASRQDHTQWNGGVPNGLFIQALARNTGEVFGVFAAFNPKVEGNLIVTRINFRDNSADFAGLQTLEEKIAALKPPPWPRDVFGLDNALAAKGKPLFDRYCGECHAARNSRVSVNAWDTPVKAVGTDPKMVVNAQRMGDPGRYTGALLPPPAPIGGRFANPAKIGDVLALSVVGSLLDEAFPITSPANLAESGVWHAVREDWASLMGGGRLDDLGDLDPSRVARLHAVIRTRLGNMFQRPASADPGAAYESRVLYGIWATAPYLHNGSVPNLWELLTPAKDRKSSFMVGSRLFDPKNVGYATDQSPFKNGTFVTDPANANGNGNKGHEYGTGLTPDERWAIIEYLKTL
ncbi:MAG TPA: di-heme-cytochrome C peroxidase [Methylomirabilota bacterium]|nr:di-heme-cytochrome C peroxidase [Methylomirabilota bacterium]